jgi:hypothetical protein
MQSSALAVCIGPAASGPVVPWSHGVLSSRIGGRSSSAADGRTELAECAAVGTSLRSSSCEGNMSEIGANLIIRAIGGAIGGNADDSFGFCIASPVG